MKSYFGYIRVSTPKQGRGVSLDEQRSAITTYAARNGLTLVDWYVETETAAHQGRTQFTKLISALSSQKAAGVIIHKIDRGARNLKDWANLGELIDRGIDVQFAHENLDMRSRGGRLAADIQAVVAADYIRNLRDEVKKGFYGRLKQGVYPLPAPVGYLDRGAGIPKAPDPVAAPLVRYAYERYSTGEIGLAGLRAELEARGLKTRKGRPLSINGLAAVLHNEFYIGLIRIARTGETFQGAHEPLISKALFDRVRAVLAGKSVLKAKTHRFRYRIMVRHADCARHLTGERQKKRFVYYRCHGPSCTGICLAENAIDAAIRTKLELVTCTEEEMRDLRDIMAEERAAAVAQGAQYCASLKLRIAQCDERLNRLADAVVDLAIDKSVYESRKKATLEERRSLNDALAESGGEPPYLKLYREFERTNTNLLRYDSLLDDEIRDTVSATCSNVSVRAKTPMIELRSPYREIAENPRNACGGPQRGNSRTRAREIFEILKSVSCSPDVEHSSSEVLMSDNVGANSHTETIQAFVV